MSLSHSDAPKGVDQRDLMALVDGHLDPDSAHAHAVRQALRGDPESAAAFDAWQRQNRAIASHYEGVLAEPLPHHLQVSAIRGRQRDRRRRLQRHAAVWALPLVVAAGALGMSWSGLQQEPDPLQRFASDMASVSDASMASGSAVSLQAGRMALPNLEDVGFRLIAQRPVRSAHASATEARYENAQGEALRLYTAQERDHDARVLKRMQAQGRSVVYWRDGRNMFALAGEDIGARRLEEIAAAALSGQSGAAGSGPKQQPGWVDNGQLPAHPSTGGVQARTVRAPGKRSAPTARVIADFGNDHPF